MTMKIKKTITLLFIFLFTSVYLFAQDKVVCKKIRRGVWHVLEHSIQKTNSNVLISIIVDTCGVSTIEIPNRYYDMSDSVAIRIGKLPLIAQDNNLEISYCVGGTGKWRYLSRWLDPKLFSVKEEHCALHYDVEFYYKDWELYDRLRYYKN